MINLFSTLTVVLVVGAFWIHDGTQSYETNLLNRISSQGQLVASNSTAAVMFDDWDEVSEILAALASDQAITSARVLRRGEVLLEEQYAELMPFERVNYFAVLGHVVHHGSLSFPITGMADAVIEISYQDQELHEAVLQLLCTVGLMLLLALVIALTLSLVMQSYITKPIQNLSDVARQVTHSKSYSKRGQVFYPDEIGGLTHDFNEMLELVEQKDLHLEETISRRTRMLEKQNKELAFQITEREKSEQAHRESEEKFEQAFVNAPIGMALVNAEQQIILHNRALERILEPSHTDDMYLEDLIGAAFEAEVGANFSQLIAGEINWFQREVACFSKQKDVLNAILSFSAVKNEADQFRYAVLQLQDITESKKLAAKLEHQAKHDALTGLANRRVLKQAVQAIIAQKDNKPHALCLLDLDQFKIVNDTCGHAAGDELLRQLGQLLMAKTKSKDLVVRLGGDEFGLVLHNCNKSQLIKKAEKLRRVIEQWEFNWNGQTFRVGVSIGAVIITRHDLSFSSLMQQADSACFIAKDRGRNQVYITEGEEDHNITSRQGEMRWVQRIHQALEHNHFVLFVQPVIGLQQQVEAGRYEVLLRMRHTEREELIPPGAFIPAAERYGLSAKIDRWVISQLIGVLQNNPARQQSNYWVNLSGVSLGDSNFLKFLEQAIKQSGLPAGMINFEITETAVMQNIGLANAIMNRLIKLGSRFALDDFGSGVSSFGYLKQLPVDVIKMDGMFVRDILSDKVDYIFVKSIIDIAKTMNITTVAEFVESDEIKRKLIEMGADFGQGFALGRPSPMLANEQSTSVSG